MCSTPIPKPLSFTSGSPARPSLPFPPSQNLHFYENFQTLASFHQALVNLEQTTLSYDFFPMGDGGNSTAREDHQHHLLANSALALETSVHPSKTKRNDPVYRRSKRLRFAPYKKDELTTGKEIHTRLFKSLTIDDEVVMARLKLPLGKK